MNKTDTPLMQKPQEQKEAVVPHHTFTQSVKDYFKRYFQFVGRSSMFDYLYICLFFAICTIGLAGLACLFCTLLLSNNAFCIFSAWLFLLAVCVFFPFAFIIPMYALKARRLQDVGVPRGWAIAIPLLVTAASMLLISYGSLSMYMILSLVDVIIFVCYFLPTDTFKKWFH